MAILHLRKGGKLSIFHIVDNYWEVLPVERLQVKDEIRLDSENNNPNFIIAEEKATKAIQKHSMDIKDEERNPQTDEAFLLLGKARYFDQRYIPAIEAFNYVLRKYIESDKLNEATIWREKTNIRLNNEELALKNLKRLLKFEQLKGSGICRRSCNDGAGIYKPESS